MNIFLIVFLPIALGFAYWLFVTGVIGAIRMLQSKHWAHTIGKIIAAEVKFKQFGSGADLDFKFVLIKTYTYNVNGTSYKSNKTLASDYLYQKDFKPMSKFPKKHDFFRKTEGYRNAEKGINYHIGRSVAVYYNPKKPKVACLDNRFNKEIFLPIGMGLFFGGGLTYLAYYLLKPYFS